MPANAVIPYLPAFLFHFSCQRRDYNIKYGVKIDLFGAVITKGLNNDN